MRTYQEMREAVKGKTLEWLKDKKFMNDMIDRWSPEDSMWDSILYEAICKAEEEQKHENI